MHDFARGYHDYKLFGYVINYDGANSRDYDLGQNYRLFVELQKQYKLSDINCFDIINAIESKEKVLRFFEE